MKDLLRDNYRAAGQLYPGPGDVEYWRYIYDESPDLIRNAHLWEDEVGRLGAFAWMNEDGTDLAIRVGSESLLPRVLAWSEETRLAGELLGESLDHNRISLGAGMAAEIAVAESLGYSRSGMRTAVFVLDLDVPPPAGETPGGVVIRNVERGDLEQRAGLNVIAQDQELDVANYERLFAESTLYDRSLDIVAEVSGALVAFATGWADPATKLGLLEPFGCKREFRRKGIARAVASECLRRLAACGMRSVYATHAGLSDGEPEDEATRFNLSMGFREVEPAVELVKEPLSPGRVP